MRWWGWGAGHQETAEFCILEAYFKARWSITKRISDFEYRPWNHKDDAPWLITFLDGTTREVWA